MLITGINGRVGAGKDTVAEMIMDLTAYQQVPYKNKKFAYKLKAMAAVLTGDKVEDFESRFGKVAYLPEWGKTRREVLLWLGSIVRKDDPDAWIKGLWSDLRTDENWLISDMRYFNEANAVKDIGGITLRVERTDNPYPRVDHPSETDLDGWNFDYVIYNDGTLEELRESVLAFLKQFKLIKPCVFS